MKRYFILVSVCLGLSACNTLNGIGKDIQKAGAVIQNAAN